MLLELAITSLAGARIALEVDADRVELCGALELGGITPAQGTVEAVVGSGIRVHALVRCRPGGFRYDADELDTMVAEARAVARGGAIGVVVGAIGDDGRLDLDAIARLADAARDAGARAVIVHRALDLVADSVAEAERLAARGGIDGVLSSGGAATAIEGVAAIRRMAESLPVTAGGGVTPDDVAALATAGASAVHASAKSWRPEPSALSLGAADEGGHWVTDRDLAAKLSTAARAVTR